MCISLAAGRHVWGTGYEVSPQMQDPLLRVTSATMCNFQLWGHRRLHPTAPQKSSCVCVILLLLPVLRKLMWGACTGRSPAPNQLPWAQCWETQRTGRCGAGFLLPVRPCRVGESRGLMGLKCVESYRGGGAGGRIGAWIIRSREGKAEGWTCSCTQLAAQWVFPLTRMESLVGGPLSPRVL